MRKGDTTNSRFGGRSITFWNSVKGYVPVHQTLMLHPVINALRILYFSKNILRKDRMKLFNSVVYSLLSIVYKFIYTKRMA